jgi:hypothetical protein
MWSPSATTAALVVHPDADERRVEELGDRAGDVAEHLLDLERRRDQPVDALQRPHAVAGLARFAIEPRVVQRDRRLGRERVEQVVVVLGEAERLPREQAQHAEQPLVEQERDAVEAAEVVAARPVDGDEPAVVEHVRDVNRQAVARDPAGRALVEREHGPAEVVRGRAGRRRADLQHVALGVEHPEVHERRADQLDRGARDRGQHALGVERRRDELVEPGQRPHPRRALLARAVQLGVGDGDRRLARQHRAELRVLVAPRPARSEEDREDAEELAAGEQRKRDAGVQAVPARQPLVEEPRVTLHVRDVFDPAGSDHAADHSTAKRDGLGPLVVGAEPVFALPARHAREGIDDPDAGDPRAEQRGGRHGDRVAHALAGPGAGRRDHRAQLRQRGEAGRACSRATAACAAKASASSRSRASNGRRARSVSTPVIRSPERSGTPSSVV